MKHRRIIFTVLASLLLTVGTASAEPKPFQVSIDDETLARVSDRFASARFPDQLTNGGWEKGANGVFLRSFASFMANDFDWRAAEVQLNAYPQFISNVDGLDIHYYHVKGEGPNPTPIILTHGWPGSVFEFLNVIGPLTRPSEYGSKAEHAFTVVIPSLPGFGFSEAPRDRTIGPVTTADLWNTLMTEELGYERYGAQGGDLGSLVTVQLATRHADNLFGIHLNLGPWSERPQTELTEEEKEWRASVDTFTQTEMAYFSLQATKPKTPSFALTDSPMGTAAWILEKFYAWSDRGAPDGKITDAFTMEELGTLVSLYTLTDKIDTSLWFYNGFLVETGGRFMTADRIDVPTGIAQFPKDLLNGRPPKSWIETQYNLIHWTEMPRGGHFAALEEPDLFVEDVRAFFSKVKELNQ